MSPPAAPSETHASPLRFPPELPISARVRDIAEAIHDHQVVVVAGATGSGKTTQLPKVALALGRGVHKLIGVTQPRRLAATSVAARVASELGSPLGTDVGYKIRFDDRTGPETFVKFMTDGILLAELEGDRLLSRYDTLIIDEVHERNLNVDFLLGVLKQILPKRPDLKVLISSATLQTDRFSEYFGGAPVLEVEGRTYPVHVFYEPRDEELELAESVARAVESAWSLVSDGDILVFLPGEREIRDAESAIRSRSLRHTEVLPLYARLASADQARVFAPARGRRVVLATNVAETSVTIPGIRVVVDTGIARLSRYDPRTGITRLQIEGISQASADQRKGRAGRVSEGVCIRLYDEQSFAARPKYTDPEVKRSGLSGVILRMASLGLGEVQDFPFLDPPHARAISEGYRVLSELGALDDRRALTPLGLELARFPTDPRISRMILAGSTSGCLEDVLVVCAALATQDPRERPRDAIQKADEAHRAFRDPNSDFVSLLRLWRLLSDAEAKGTGQLRRTCKSHFLSYPRVREWREVHRQFQELLAERGLGAGGKKSQGGRKSRAAESDVSSDPAAGDALHRALLAGMLSRVGYYRPELRSYVGSKQTRFVIHPSSALAKKPPAWVMVFELVETSQLFARTVARILPEWLAEVGAHQLKKSHSDPFWSEKAGRAKVKEQATLFGLPVFVDRLIDLSTVSPVSARRMFIDHALVRGEWKSRGAFQEANRARVEDAKRLRDKARKSDMGLDEPALFAFFDRRLPASVVDGKTFEAFRLEAEASDPLALVLGPDDISFGDQTLSDDDYPDSVMLHGVTVRLAYKFEPTMEDDGITVTLPLALLPQMRPGELEWTVRGYLADKVERIIEELPKPIRRAVGPARATAALLAQRLTPFQGDFRAKLAEELRQHSGLSVREEDVRLECLPPYLCNYLRLVDASGKVVAEGRDTRLLWKRHGADAQRLWMDRAPEGRWTRKGITTWDFGDLPEYVLERAVGAEIRAYPALLDRGTSCELALVESSSRARTETRGGILRLVCLSVRGMLSSLETRLPKPFPRVTGEPVSRADEARYRTGMVLRIVEDAFALGQGESLPRTQKDFESRLVKGRGNLGTVAAAYEDALRKAGAEASLAVAALLRSAKHPSGKAARDDMTQQLRSLLAIDRVVGTPLERLRDYPRYLRAIVARLGRAVADPRKDADKAGALTPLFEAFAALAPREENLATREEILWLLEELRVATFAPELKPKGPVTPARLLSMIAECGR